MEEESNKEDHEENDGLGESDGGEEGPVDNTEVQLTHRYEYQRRKRKCSNECSQTFGLHITDDGELASDVSEEDDSETLDQSRVEVVQVTISTVQDSVVTDILRETMMMNSVVMVVNIIYYGVNIQTSPDGCVMSNHSLGDEVLCLFITFSRVLQLCCLRFTW